MLFRILLTLSLVFFLPPAFAKDTTIPLELLELLGEFDDAETLEAILSETDLKTSQNKNKGTENQTIEMEQSRTLPQEIKR